MRGRGKWRTWGCSLNDTCFLVLLSAFFGVDSGTIRIEVFAALSAAAMSIDSLLRKKTVLILLLMRKCVNHPQKH